MDSFKSQKTFIAIQKAKLIILTVELSKDEKRLESFFETKIKKSNHKVRRQCATKDIQK